MTSGGPFRPGRVDIGPLADHPDAIPVLEEWFEREWAPYYGPEGPGDAERDLHETTNRDSLPITLVAREDGVLCGTAALKQASVSTHPELGPWLAALLVAPAYRGKGIADRLVQTIEAMARRMGFQALYVGTNPATDGGSDAESLEDLVRRRGWRLVDRVEYFVSDAAIYRKEL